MTTPLRVTAMLDSITVTPTGIFGLDAPLSWGYIQRALTNGQKPPPLTETFAPDMPLPLDTWGADPWVWCTSPVQFDIVQEVTVNIRRKPATQAMARYSTAAKHHAGLGPHKARDTILPAFAARSATWHVNATDTAELADILSYVTHLGPRHRNGFGHITQWVIEETSQPNLWSNRPLPAPAGTLQPIRAPYWHPSRRYPCQGETD